MATRKSEGKQKLLSKTYSEIGVAPGHNNSSAETPTPSEKVSRWHRDILLVSPNTGAAGANPNNPHPRQCICDQCMAEYGTYRIYNQLLDINPHSSVIKVQEDIAEEQVPAPPPVNPVKNDKVRPPHEILFNLTNSVFDGKLCLPIFLCFLKSVFIFKKREHRASTYLYVISCCCSCLSFA